MFPEDTLHALTREMLAGEIIAREWPRPAPLDADSYIARSVLQKAIRRGMTDAQHHRQQRYVEKSAGAPMPEPTQD